MSTLDQKKHWKVLACISGLAASSIGVNMNTIGVFYTPVSESLGFYRGSFALHTTIMSLILSITALFIPRILARIDIKKVIQLGVILSVSTTFLMAFTQSLWVFYLLAAIRGLGAAFYSPVPLTILINNWFDKKNGVAMSLGFGSSGIVGALMSPVFNLVIQQYNWQIGFIAMAVASCLFCVPAFFYKFTLHPKEEGLEPYGFIEENAEKKSNVEEPNVGTLLDMRFLVLASIGLFLSLITGFPHHLSGYAETLDYSAAVGAWMLSASMFGNIAFKLLAGTLGDLVGSIKTTLIILGLNAAAIFMLLLVHESGFLIVSSFFLGGIMCFPIVILPMLTIKFYSRKNYMKVYPFFAFMTGLGGAIGVSVIGYIYDFTSSYALAFYSAVILLLVSACLIFFLSIRTEKKKATKMISIKE